jgi:hypothetical protein
LHFNTTFILPDYSAKWDTKTNRNGKTKTRKTNEDKEGSERERKIMDKQGFLEKQEEVHYVMEKKERKKAKQKKWYESCKEKEKKKEEKQECQQFQTISLEFKSNAL